MTYVFVVLTILSISWSAFAENEVLSHGRGELNCFTTLEEMGQTHNSVMEGEGNIDQEIADILKEQRKILARPRKSNPQLETRLHRTTLSFMISGLDTILWNGSRTVYDGFRQFEPYKERQEKLTRQSKAIIIGLRNDLIAKLNEPFMDRGQFIADSVLFSGLYSSFRRVYMAKAKSFEEVFKGHEQQVIIFGLNLEEKIENYDGQMSFESVIAFIRQSDPFSRFINGRLDGVPMSLTIDARNMIRLWGRSGGPLGVASRVLFIDGFENGFNPLLFLWHDCLHWITGNEVIAHDGDKLTEEFTEKINRHLDNLANLEEVDLETAIILEMGHEENLPNSELKAWAQGQKVKDIKKRDFPSSDLELANRIVQRLKKNDFAMDFGTREVAQRKLIQAIQNLKELYLGWSFLPDGKRGAGAFLAP